MKSSDKDSETYFCIASDGLLYILGNHGDYEAAEATAKDMGLEVIWMFGEETALSWQASLASAADQGLLPEVH